MMKKVTVKVPIVVRHQPEHAGCSEYTVDIIECWSCKDGYSSDFDNCPHCYQPKTKPEKPFGIWSKREPSSPTGAFMQSIKCRLCKCFVEVDDLQAHKLMCD